MAMGKVLKHNVNALAGLWREIRNSIYDAHELYEEKRSFKLSNANAEWQKIRDIERMK